MENENGALGQVRIADDVIVIIAELALNDVEGIYTSDKRRTRKNLSKGIEVHVADGQVFCNIEFFIANDCKIPPLATLVQTRVKTAVENMTGLQVAEVNVRIAGIVKDEPAEEA